MISCIYLSGLILHSFLHNDVKSIEKVEAVLIPIKLMIQLSTLIVLRQGQISVQQIIIYLEELAPLLPPESHRRYNSQCYEYRSCYNSKRNMQTKLELFEVGLLLHAGDRSNLTYDR